MKYVKVNRYYTKYVKYVPVRVCKNCDHKHIKANLVTCKVLVTK